MSELFTGFHTRFELGDQVIDDSIVALTVVHVTPIEMGL